jgi:hypothetical protein
LKRHRSTGDFRGASVPLAGFSFSPRSIKKRRRDAGATEQHLGSHLGLLFIVIESLAQRVSNNPIRANRRFLVPLQNS